jgi:hypothetical protein
LIVGFVKKNINNLLKKGIYQYIQDTIQLFQIWHNLCSTPFGNYGTYETMFDQKRWKKTKNIGKILPILYFPEQ